MEEEDDVAPFDTAGQVTLWSRGLGFALDPAAVETLGGSTWDLQQDSYTDAKADRGSHWTSLSSRRRRSNTLYRILPLIDCV